MKLKSPEAPKFAPFSCCEIQPIASSTRGANKRQAPKRLPQQKMATPFFTPALEDIGPDAGPKADAAPAGQYPDELAPFWGFVCIVSWLASLDQGNFFPADQAQRPSSTALDALAEEEEKSAVATAHDDEDALLPYGAFKAIVESCAPADPDEPAPPFHKPLHAPHAEAAALAPYLAGLDPDDEAPLLPYLAFVALAHLLFHDAATAFAAKTTESSALFFASLWRPIEFMLAPFSASREPAAGQKKTRSSEDLASLAGRKLFGGDAQRSVRVRTAL